MSVSTSSPAVTIYKSNLTTPDPYHIPGYAGFCPQKRYKIGETFGRTTNRLLADESVASSGQFVLARNTAAMGHEATAFRDHRHNIVKSRENSLGDYKFNIPMVPGYTGFVPKIQNYFGKRFAETTVEAVSDFEVSKKKQNQRIAEVRLSGALANKRVERKDFELPDITNRYMTPLEPVKEKVLPEHAIPAPPTSPYALENENPRKMFISGYRGFVPRERGLLGAGYPVTTHMALNEFTDEQKRIRACSAKPFELKRKSSTYIDSKPIYPRESGLIPRYTGHVPATEDVSRCSNSMRGSTSTNSSAEGVKPRPPKRTRVSLQDHPMSRRKKARRMARFKIV